MCGPVHFTKIDVNEMFNTSQALLRNSLLPDMSKAMLVKLIFKNGVYPSDKIIPCCFVNWEFGVTTTHSLIPICAYSSCNYVLVFMFMSPNPFIKILLEGLFHTGRDIFFVFREESAHCFKYFVINIVLSPEC